MRIVLFNVSCYGILSSVVVLRFDKLTRYIYILKNAKYNMWVVEKMIQDKKLMVVTEISNKEEFEEMKAIVEIFAVTGRVRELALKTN